MNRPTTLILVAIVPAAATAEPTRALAALAPMTPEGVSAGIRFTP